MEVHLHTVSHEHANKLTDIVRSVVLLDVDVHGALRYDDDPVVLCGGGTEKALKNQPAIGDSPKELTERAHVRARSRRFTA